MPLPKGIYSDPAVRGAWMAERRAILGEFDRRTRAGEPISQAARAVGRTPPGLRQMRAGLESLEGRATGRTKGERIDLGLALLSVANPPGPERAVVTARDIAAWCGCSHAAIQSIERRALAKLHRRLAPLLHTWVVPGEFAAEGGVPVRAAA